MGDGIRPIGIRNVHVQMAVKALMHRVRDELHAALPHEFCLGKPAGCEQLAHLLRTWEGAHPDHLRVSLDVKNAYNTLDRGALLAAVDKHAPSLSRVMHMVYGAPFTTTFAQPAADGAPAVSLDIAVERGIVQGGVEGSLLYCLSVMETLDALRASHPGVCVFTLIDGVEAVGPVDKVLAFLPAYKARMAALGQEVQPAKSVARCPTPAAPDQLAAQLTASGYPLVTNAGDAATAGSIVGGIPVGTREYETRVMAGLADAVIASVGDIRECLENRAFHLRGDVPLVQGLFRVLRMAIPARLIYHVRGVPPSCTADAVGRVDRAVFTAMCQMAGILEDDPLPEANAETTRARAFLPIRHGGLGVTALAGIAEAAYISSWGLAGVTVRGIMGDAILRDDGTAPLAVELDAAVAALQAAVPDPDAPLVTASLLKEAAPKLQHALCDRLAKKKRGEIAAALRSEGERMTFIGHGGTGAGAFLTANPARRELRMPDGDFSIALRLRLGTHVLTPEAAAEARERYSDLVDNEVAARAERVHAAKGLAAAAKAKVLLAVARLETARAQAAAAEAEGCAEQQLLVHKAAIATNVKLVAAAAAAAAGAQLALDSAEAAPLVVVAPQRGCAVCGRVTDGGQLHAQTCNTGRHQQTARHNALRNAIAALAKEMADMLVLLEPHMNTYFHRKAGAPGAADARADIMLTSTSDGSFRRVIDVTVGAPRTTLSAAQRAKEGATAAFLERGKASQYNANHHIHDMKQIVPFGIEVSGAMGPSAEEFVKCLAQRSEGAGRGTHAQRVQYIRERVSVALQRGNAWMVREWQSRALGQGWLDVQPRGGGAGAAGGGPAAAVVGGVAAAAAGGAAAAAGGGIAAGV